METKETGRVQEEAIIEAGGEIFEMSPRFPNAIETEKEEVPEKDTKVESEKEKVPEVERSSSMNNAKTWSKLKKYSKDPQKALQ